MKQRTSADLFTGAAGATVAIGGAALLKLSLGILPIAVTLTIAGLAAAQPTITEFPVPTANSELTRIAAGPDGNLWFTEGFANQIGRITPMGTITEFPALTLGGPVGITSGPDGNLWFGVEPTSTTVPKQIGRITPTGTVTLFSVASTVDDIGAGPDGNLWYTTATSIGRITPSGTATEFALPAGHVPQDIAAGSDGNLWFTESRGTFGPDQVGRITPTGTITEFPVPTGGSQPLGITDGPDGNLWFTEFAGNNIGRITPTGTITEFPVPTGGSRPRDITDGPDGNLWFTELAGNNIGRITPTGTITEFPVPTGGSQPTGITDGPDGNLWFEEGAANQIGRITLNLAAYDSVVASLKPLTVKIPKGTAALTKALAVKVLNADLLKMPGHTIRLEASDGDCPAGTVSTPDFGGATNSVLVPGGSQKTAQVQLTFTSAGVATPNMKSPYRCTVRFTATSVGGSDPNVTNNVAPLVIDVIDLNDF